jgi:hypothetical protein
MPDWTFPGLKTAIKKIIGTYDELEIYTPDSVKNTEPLLFMYNGGSSQMFNYLLESKHKGPEDGLSLTLYFYKKKDHIQFKKLEICPLFDFSDESNEDSNIWSYSIIFGDDYEGAAKVATKIFTDFYHVSPNKKLIYDFRDIKSGAVDTAEYASEGTPFTFFGCLTMFFLAMAVIYSLIATIAQLQ